MIDEHANLFLGNSNSISRLKFLVDGCDNAENPVLLNRSTKHEVR